MYCCLDLCMCWFSLSWVTVWGGIISSQSPIERLQISSPPQNSLKLKKKLIFFSTYVMSLNLDENSMGIAMLYFASLCLFFRRFYKALKINFVTKSDQVQIFKKHHITNFLYKARSKEKNILRRGCF
jgi:hypothetical protein